MTRRVGVIGSGRAAAGLSRALRAAGHRVASVPGRSGGQALGTLARKSDLLLICVTDEAIRLVAARLARLPEQALSNKVVLHTSGAQGPEPLAGLARRGASVGCLHPLVSFPPGAAARGARLAPMALIGAAFAVDGAPRARKAAGALARGMGGRPLHIPAPARPAYHMIATLVASGTAALLDAGIEVARARLGLPEPLARRALLTLARSVLANVSAFGTARALTGPAARGDAATVARHLETLSRSPHALRELYTLLSRRAVRMALADGRLSPRDAARLAKRLSRHPDD